jgi:EmrB/QacA subfamily drug resistance transporter
MGWEYEVAPQTTRDAVPGAARAATRAGAPDSARPWLALVVIGMAQLMIALDATIVNIALPSAQAELHVSDANRQWVVTAYTLAFAGLVLLGGRISDYFGRKRAFLAALLGFAAASMVAGAAGSLWLLVAARAVQGMFAAVLAPTTLALLTVTFTEAKRRAKAFAVFGAIAGSGAAVGLVLGGVLAHYLSWRWCLYVNLPISVAAAVGGAFTLRATPAAGGRRFDFPSVLLSTGGLVALVYACTEAVSRGWESPLVLGPLVAAVVLLAGFVVRQARAEQPLLPLRVVLDRNRGGSYLAMGFALAGMLGLFLFLTYYLQAVLGYSPIQAGLAFLPLAASVQVGATLIASRLLPRVGPRALMVPGLLAGAAAMVLLSRIEVASGYAGLVLPAEILLGTGMGCVFVSAIGTATYGVDPRDAGIASGVVSVAQQTGGSLGTALLNTIAAGATAGALATEPRPVALVHGYATAAGWAAGLFAVAAVLAALLVNAAPRRDNTERTSR